MSKKTGYLLGILLTIIIGMLLMWFFCCGSGLAADDSITNDQNNLEQQIASPDPTSMAFAVRDANGELNFSIPDNFEFTTSEFAHLSPVATTINGGIGKLQAYLDNDDNKLKYLDITGYYDTEEKNTSAFPNLGIARANDVKNYFVSQGIPSAKINTYGQLREELVPDGTIYRGPVAYKIGAYESADADAEQMAALKARINANPLILYFQTGQSSINLTADQRQKVADISRYLDHVSGSSATIVGHTDNTGNPDAHIPLGLKRADFAKGYLQRNGISEAQINTSSKGDQDPIADNGTEDGRAKNRRSVVTIN